MGLIDDDNALRSPQRLLDDYASGRRRFERWNLDGADLAGANLSGASFYYASLRAVDLSEANLHDCQFKAANLTEARLDHSNLGSTDLIDGRFIRSTLTSVDLTGAALNRTIFAGADLTRARFNNSRVDKTEFTGARLSRVSLNSAALLDCDLSEFCGAKGIRHESPSNIDAQAVIKTYRHPRFKDFMLDCGVPEIFAEYMIDCAKALGDPLLRSLMRSTFISYGGPDEEFARKLYESLRAHGVVTFFFPESAMVGERINNEVYSKLQKHDRIILICSSDSLNRPGVLNEIQETLDREARDGGATYLLPVTIDDYLFTGWRDAQPVLAERLNRRVVADFRRTRTRSAFNKAVSRVLNALKKRHVGEL